MNFHNSRNILSALIFLFVFLLIMSGCSGGGIQNGLSTSYATYVDSEDMLIGGPSSQGAIGDILIYNNVARFIIKATDYPSPVPLRGEIIDADVRRIPGESGEDSLNGVLFYYYPRHYIVPDSFLRGQGKISIIDDGTLSGVPDVRVTGKDEYYPLGITLTPPHVNVKALEQSLPLNFIIDYSLFPDSPCLQVKVVVQNNSASAEYIYPGIMVLPGPGKFFSGGYGFGDPGQKGPFNNIIYLAKEFHDVTFGFYPGSMVTKPLADEGVVSGEDGYALYSPGDGKTPLRVTIDGNSTQTFVYEVCAVKGYSGEFYSYLVKKFKLLETTVDGNACLTNGNDRMESDSSGNKRKICTTPQDIEKGISGVENKGVEGTDVFIEDGSGNVIAHTKTGNDSAEYYRMFTEFDPFYLYKTIYTGFYHFDLPGKNYDVVALKRNWAIPTPQFLIIFPPSSQGGNALVEIDHADFVFSSPVTLDVFAKELPAIPSSARVVISSKDFYPASVTGMLDKFGFTYYHPYSGKVTEVYFVDSSGHLLLNLANGKYDFVADKGVEYNQVTGTVNLNQSLVILLKFKKVLDEGEYRNIDPFVTSYSFVQDFYNKSLALNAFSIDDAIIFENNLLPSTWETSVPSIFGSVISRDDGTFALYPVNKKDYDNFENVDDVSLKDLFKLSSNSVILDPSSPSSYFNRLSATVDFNSGKIRPSDYDNSFIFVQIFPSMNPKESLLWWFRLLQLTTGGKKGTFVFHPFIAGSFDNDPIYNPPGLMRMYVNTGKISGDLIRNENCSKDAIGSDFDQLLCRMREGVSTAGRFLFFSVSLTSTGKKEAIPGEVISLGSGDKLYLNIDVQSPVWAGFNKIYVFDGLQDYGNDVTDPFASAYSMSVTPTVVSVGDKKSMARYEWKRVFEYPYNISNKADSWCVVFVSGENDASGYPELKSLGISNPVFIDSDTTPGYNPPCPGAFCPSK